MARKESDIRKDLEILKTLSIGTKVCYTRKDGSKKEGIISKITGYDPKRYFRYSSVTVALDNGKHINVSPRNLSRKECVSLKTLYESGHENLKYGGYIRYTEEEGSEYYDLCADTGAIIDTVLLSDGEEVSILKETDENVYVEVSETIAENTETHYHIMFSSEEFSIATYR